MQIASTVSSTYNVHGAGNFGIAFFHKWICGYLVLTGAPRQNIFLSFPTMKESLLHCLLTKSGATKITSNLHENNLVEYGTMYKCSSEVGGKSSHRTNDGCKKGEHWIDEENRMSTASSERGKSSHKTDNGCKKGEHWIDEENRMSTASSECGKSSHRTNNGCKKGEHWIDEENRMSTAPSEHGKKGDKKGRESSCGKSRSGDIQFFLIEEIDSKNNLINQDMAWYVETFRDVLAWLCSEDVKFGYGFSSIVNYRKKLDEWRESSIINAKCPDDRRQKLSKLTEKPGKLKRVSFEEIDTVTVVFYIKERDARRNQLKAKKMESV
jgi:hypothetical protein